MPIVDSKTGKPKKDYSLKELTDLSKLLRSYIITAITLAGSGHTGGCMSAADIAIALYFKIANHDPSNPGWEDRDRIYWSVGHKAPTIYAALGLAGYYDVDDTVLLRKLYAPFEGHPNALKLPGIEASSGSLGQGLGIAVGSALSARLKEKEYKTYCILGDGELDEGSVWEAAMSAAHYKLNNLIAVVDRNRLQIDGYTSEVMEIEPLKAKWTSFGWEVFECDGHSIKGLIDTFTKAKEASKPVVIIANTVKGKCIFYAEDVCSYHGAAPRDGLKGPESLETALKDIASSGFIEDKLPALIKKADSYQKNINKKIEKMLPKYSKDCFWNAQKEMKAEMVPNRIGFGQGLEKAGSDPRVVALGADITDSIKMSSFYQNHPERRSRFFSMGIAEANMTTVAAGLAREGYIPFIGSYGVFITGRNWDQLRTTVCYNNYNVKIVDAHGGISVGPDGATHQTLEDITNLYYLPNMHIAVPVDSVEAEKATLAIKDINGPAAIRIAREATPVVTTSDDTPYKFGLANIIRYRSREDNFIGAFDTYLSTDYINEDEDITIIGCGPITAEAMRAAYILAEEYKLSTRVINMHTVKPIDREAIINAARDTRLILTCEEHQVGGFGNIVAGVIAQARLNKPIKMEMIGINDRFGQSGAPWELMKLFGLTAEFIAEKLYELVERMD